MSIFGAMSSSVSSLQAHSSALGMISDNISNVNTVGFKDKKASFTTLVTQQATQTAFSPGGVRSTPLANVDKQGLLEASDNNTDIAISGNGFFVVNQRPDPGIGDDFMFTRAGEFRADEEGNLTNTAGFFLQGWPLDAEGNRPAAPEAIESLETVNISGLDGLPRATSTIDIGANLPSTADEGDIDDPQHAMTVQIFDSLGNAHNLSVEFAKADDDASLWDVRIQAPKLAQDPDGDDSAEIEGMEDITGQISFNGDGSLASVDFDADLGIELDMDNNEGEDGTITFNLDGFNTGAADSEIDLSFGTIGGLDGMSQFANDFAVTDINQNGLRFGNFTGVNIDEDGIVTAVFDNGRRRDLFQIPIANFNNPNGLEERSGNAFLRSDESGEMLLTQAGTGGSGVVAPGALEGSTVDLATEFTDLITTQRAFSSATRIITTSDEMLQELTAVAR